MLDDPNLSQKINFFVTYDLGYIFRSIFLLLNYIIIYFFI